jgi:hypothetical protein
MGSSKYMLHRLRKFLRLPVQERRLLARVVLLLSITRAGLVVVGYGRARKLFSRFLKPPYRRPKPPFGNVDQVVDVVKIGARFVLGDKPCLSQAMVTQFLLSRRSILSVIRIGVVRSEGGRLEAHAWIEHEGRILIGETSRLERYSRFPPLRLWQDNGPS